MGWRISILILGLIVSPCLLFKSSAVEELTGMDIAFMIKYNNRPKTQIVWIKMVIQKKKNGKWETINIKNIVAQHYIHKYKRYKTLWRHLDGLDKGMTILSIENDESEEDTTYVYYPAHRRSRLVADFARHEDIEGTDICYADLGERKIYDFTYKRKPDTNINGIKCYNVIWYPKNTRKWGLSYGDLYCSIDYAMPILLKQYNLNNEIHKIFNFTIKKYGPIYWVKHLIAENPKKKSRTIMITTKTLVNVPLNYGDYDTNNLGNVWRW